MVETVRGLRRQETGRSTGRQSRGREQVQIDPNPRVGIRPVASPVDTTVVAPRPPSAEETEAFKIAQGLGVAGPELVGVLDTINARKTDDARAQAEFEINQMTPQQVQELVSSGAIDEWDDPRRRSAMQTLAGSRLGHERMRQLVAEYAEVGDPASVNIDQFISDGFSRDADLSGDNDFLRGYNQATRGISDRLRVAHDEAISGQLQEAAEANLFGSWAGEVRTGLIEGQDPQVLADQIISGRGAFASALGIEGPEQAETMMALAEQIVDEGLQGSEEFARALLTTDLPGTGPLGNIGRFRDRAQRVLEQGRQNSNFQQRVANLGNTAQLQEQAGQGQLDISQLDSLLADGTLTEASYLSIRQTNERARIRIDHENSVRLEQIDAQDVIDGQLSQLALTGRYAGVSFADTQRVFNEGTDREFTTGYNSQSEMDRAVEGMFDQILDAVGVTDPAEREAQRTWLYANNGIVNQRWQRQFSAAFQAIPIDANGEVPESIGEALDLFNRIYTVSPGYAGQLVEDREMFQFFNGYRTFVTSSYTPEEAQNLTLQSVFNYQAGLRVPTGDITEEIRRELDEVPNAGQVQSDILPLANFLYLSGQATVEQAVEGAVQSYRDRSVLMNGAYVPINDRTLPPDFIRLAHAALFREAAREGLDIDALYLSPMGVDGQRWNIMRHDTNIPVPTNTYMLDQMRGFADEITGDRLEELDAYIAARHDRWDVRLRNEMLDQSSIFPDASGFGQVYVPEGQEEFIQNGGLR